MGSFEYGDKSSLDRFGALSGCYWFTSGCVAEKPAQVAVGESYTSISGPMPKAGVWASLYLIRER